MPERRADEVRLGAVLAEPGRVSPAEVVRADWREGVRGRDRLLILARSLVPVELLLLEVGSDGARSGALASIAKIAGHVLPRREELTLVAFRVSLGVHDQIERRADDRHDTLGRRCLRAAKANRAALPIDVRTHRAF